jgi:hypothetical protein
LNVQANGFTLDRKLRQIDQNWLSLRPVSPSNRGRGKLGGESIGVFREEVAEVGIEKLSFWVRGNVVIIRLEV